MRPRPAGDLLCPPLRPPTIDGYGRLRPESRHAPSPPSHRPPDSCPVARRSRGRWLALSRSAAATRLVSRKLRSGSARTSRSRNWTSASGPLRSPGCASTSTRPRRGRPGHQRRTVDLDVSAFGAATGPCRRSSPFATPGSSCGSTGTATWSRSSRVRLDRRRHHPDRPIQSGVLTIRQEGRPTRVPRHRPHADADRRRRPRRRHDRGRLLGQVDRRRFDPDRRRRTGETLLVTAAPQKVTPTC